MSNYEELFVDVEGVKTRLLKGGKGPPLVWFHGAGGVGLWFAHHILLSERFTVYAPEHPGWGGSDSPEWMDDMQDYVLFHDSLLRQLGLDSPVLVGHSLGGWMAAAFAATYPGRLKALALVNAAGLPFQDEVPDFFAAAARGGPEFASLLFHKLDVAAFLMPANPTLEETLRFYHELTSTARLTWHRWFEDKFPRRLARIDVPTAVLWGAHERLFPVSHGERYAAAIPGAKLRVIPDCGHMLPFECPEELAEEIMDLWKGAR